jgi:Protein kinase domain
LEHMDGGSLQDLMKTGPQSSAVIQGISRQLFAGLAHLHSLRIIHRDVKPSNCLINSAGCVKLADFGLARTLGANSLAESFLGTYEFMSPERVAGGSYSFASDVWALGLTLHAVAIGEYPYRAVGGKKQRKPKRMGYWALINAIQEQETPLPPSPPFDFRFRCFIQAACEKVSLLRPSAAVLLRHPFLCDAVSDVTQEQADKELKEAVEGSVAWLVKQVRLGAGETEAEIDAPDPAPEGEDEQQANPDVEAEQEDDEEEQEEEEERKKKERKLSAPVVFVPTLIEAMTAAEAAEVADAWARYAAARLVTHHLRASEGEAAAASAASAAAMGVGAGVGEMSVPTPPPQANRSNQQRDASSALDDTAAEAASLSAPAAPAVHEFATPNDKRGKIRLEEEEEEQRRFKAAASRFDIITTGSVSAASVDALARDISCDPALLRTAFHAAVGDIRMAVMRAIAEGGVGLDWTKETAVEEQMGRQGGLRLQSTLSKIRDWVPPPPESESESDSGVEDEEEERGDTDEENLLFSDDDCVVTSGEEDSSDSEGEREEGPVLSAAEVLAAREAALQGLATNGNDAPAAPASLASMKRMLGGPPAVPPRVGEAASSSNGSKLPPVAGARRGRGGGRITSRVKKV